VFALLLASLLGACQSMEIRTGKAVGCSAREVEVVKGKYTDAGATTVWCARCKGKLYHCVSNPDKSRVQCLESTARDACGS
jgi:hypothetical protein